MLAVGIIATIATIAAPAIAEDAALVAPVPAAVTKTLTIKREALRLARKVEAAKPALTSDVLTAYVARQQALQNFDGFEVVAPAQTLTEDVLLGYIAKRRNDALEAIERVDVTSQPALTPAVLTAYASKEFEPTAKKVKFAESEKLCLSRAIYHEARGEPVQGQLAVANVIINRAFSKRYPSTICGVVYQNADKGRYKCQFTFACDGRPETATERAAWSRSMQLAEQAFYDYQKGARPGVVPNGTLYYHTRAVAPRWSHTFQRVAAIGAHLFYTPN